MAQVVGILLVVLFIGGTARFAVHVYQGLKAEGVLPLPKIGNITGRGVRGRAKAQRVRARQRATRTGRTVQVIAAEAIATNWLARKAHRREQRAADPKPPKQPAATTPTEPGDTPMTDGSGIRDDTEPRPLMAAVAERRTPPTEPGGPSMTTPAMNGAGAASDYLSALTRMLTEATAGGLRSKTRAHLALGEGLPQQATTLEQYAKQLQESGLYPASVWERVTRAAGFIRAAGAEMAESGNELQAIASTPAGELGRKTPHRDELVNQ